MKKQVIDTGKVVLAARKVFRAYGLAKTTMEDLASAAGIAKSSLYCYYKSKEEVFQAVVQTEFREMLAAVTAEMDKHATCAGKINAYFTTHFANFSRKLTLYSASLQEVRKHGELMRRIKLEANTSEVKMLTELLREGVRSGEFTGITLRECGSIAAIGIIGLHSIELNTVVMGGSSTNVQNFRTLTKVFLRGIK
jgi:AcrR family transcriptional regulator